MNMPWEESSVFAWAVGDLPEVTKVGHDIMLVHGKGLVHVFAMPHVTLNDVLKALHEQFPRLGYVPLEIMSQKGPTPPDVGGEAQD